MDIVWEDFFMEKQEFVEFKSVSKRKPGTRNRTKKLRLATEICKGRK